VVEVWKVSRGGEFNSNSGRCKGVEEMEGVRKYRGVVFIKEVELSKRRDSGKFGTGIVMKGA
jgi:hypothetical protein